MRVHRGAPVVDVHAHLIVSELTRDVAPTEPWRPRVFRDGGRQVIEVGGREIRSAVHELVDPQGLLRVQSEWGVDRTVVSPWVPLLRYDEEPSEALRSGRIYNEALGNLVRAHPQHLSALGTVPLQDPELASQELETAVREYGLGGVEVAASVRGVYLGDDRFRPFWAAAEDAGAIVFIHPTTRGFDAPAFADYYLWNAVGNPLETTISAAHLVMAGVLEAHPRLTVILAHGGGALPALRGRLRHAYRVQPQARSRLRDSPEASIRRLYFDTVVHDPDVLRALVDYAGPEHVLLGSDYPFDMGVDRPVDPVRALALDPEAEVNILGGNAVRLFGLEG